MSIKAQGTLLKVAAVSTYSTVGEVMDFNGPQQSRPVLDNTNLASTSRQKLVGIPDAGTLSFQVHWDYADAGQDIVRSAFDSGALMNWQILVPAGAGGSSSVATTLSFTGYVTQMAAQGSIDGIVQGSLTVAISGLVTEAASS